MKFLALLLLLTSCSDAKDKQLIFAKCICKNFGGLEGFVSVDNGFVFTCIDKKETLRFPAGANFASVGNCSYTK